MADLVAALAELRVRAGAPSLRDIEALSGVSRSTLSSVFAGKSIPSRETMARIVVVLGGNPQAFTEPWKEAQREKLERGDVDGDGGPLPLPAELIELREIRKLLERIVQLLEADHV